MLLLLAVVFVLFGADSVSSVYNYGISVIYEFDPRWILELLFQGLSKVEKSELNS